MARKKTTTVVIENPDDAAELGGDEIASSALVEPSPEEMAETDAIDYLLSLGGDDGVRFRVDKLPTPGKANDRIAFCMNYTRDSLSLDSIRENFGGGTYKIIAYGAGSRYAGSRTVTIADLPKSQQAQSMNAPSADLAAILQAARGDGGNSTMTMMAEFIRQQAAQTTELLKALVTRAPEGAKGPTTLEILQLIREMKQDQPKSSEAGAVDMLLKGIELGKEFTGGGGEEGGLLGMAGKGLDMLRPLIEREASKPVATPEAPRPALPASAPAAPAQPAPEGDPMLKQLNWLRQQTMTLCHYAARGKNPELYAEVMLDNLPDFITEADLLARLKEPNAIAQLSQVNTEILKYRPWFEEFRKAMVRLLDETDEPEVLGPGPGIDDPADGIE